MPTWAEQQQSIFDAASRAFASLPQRGSQTNWSVNTGEPATWDRLRHLASDDQALADAIEANGFNMQLRTLQKLGQV